MNRIERLARKGILEVPAYVPGKPVEEVRRELGLADILKMASNENPLGPSPRGVEAARAALSQAHVYPEGTAPALREALALRHSVAPGMIVIGNGADNVISMICQAFLNPGEEMLTGTPTFPTYELATLLAGGRPVSVPLRDHTFDLDGLLARVGSKTKLVFLCSPNNPTGTWTPSGELERFAAALPDHVIMVVDAAYGEYVDDPDYTNGTDLVRQGRNVIILHTFSKIFGLAGLRVGYGIAPPEAIAVLERVREPFPVSRPAQAAALAALEDNDHVERSRAVNGEGRELLYKELSARGLGYVSTRANFLLIDTGMAAETVYRGLLGQGVIVRPGDIWGYPTSIRLTIGTEADNRRFLKALDNVLSREVTVR